MTAVPAHTAQVHIDRPLDGFSDCHSGILAQLQSFAELPELADAVDKCRRVAGLTLETFEQAVLEHRADEEHAAFKELEFLPVGREILGRNSNHMAALRLSLHLRRTPQPLGYI